MTDETPIAWAENERAQRVLARLQRGPASTLELQDEEFVVHAPRQIWELRHWYGHRIRTGRLPNNVAVYQLLPPLPVTRPSFGDPELIREMRRPARRNVGLRL